MTCHTDIRMSHKIADGDASGSAAGLTTVLAYVRVTTEGQLDDADLARQIERLQLFAQRYGLEIVHIYQEQRHGALSSPQDRPALHDCLADAMIRGCRILITSPSRLSRSTGHAWQIHAEHPGRFIFAEPLPGYEKLPWPVEVEECHEAFPDLTQAGTMVAMDKQKRQGRKFGAGDGGVAGRAAAAKVKEANRRSRIESMAEVLAERPDWATMTRREVATFLNDREHRPPMSTPRCPTTWTKGNVTEPLKAAKELLHTWGSSGAVLNDEDGSHNKTTPSGRASELPVSASGASESQASGENSSAQSIAPPIATTKPAGTHRAILETLSAYGPVRGATKARADTDTMAPPPGPRPTSVNETNGSADATPIECHDPAGTLEDVGEPVEAEAAVELTHEEEELVRVRQNPLWGRF